MADSKKKWADCSDYILGITKEIWEERHIHTIKDYYTQDAVVRSPYGINQGNQDVINDTVAILAEFPDRQLLGEDVIWSGEAQTGMLSSHRSISLVSHSGSGVYGRATNKKLRYRAIFDCHVLKEQISDEWLIRDQAAIAQQLGLTAEDYARKSIEREGGIEKCRQPFTSEQEIKGLYQGRGNDNSWGCRYEDILKRLMNAEFSVVPQSYDRACFCEYPEGVSAISHGAVDHFWLSLRSALPNALFSIEHRIGREDPLLSPRAAIRWSLQGKHEGYGAFGKPSGAHLYVMGISHAEFGPWGLRREYSLYDSTAVWKQILLHKG